MEHATLVKFGTTEERWMELEAETHKHPEGLLTLSRPGRVRRSYRAVSDYYGIRWEPGEILWDTLEVLPTRWERFLAFFTRRPALPRAVVIPKKGA